MYSKPTDADSQKASWHPPISARFRNFRAHGASGLNRERLSLLNDIPLSLHDIMSARIMMPELCREKAAEARFLAGRTKNEAAKIMLEHIAETWERMALKLVEKY